jgi:hypothetical protein
MQPKSYWLPVEFLIAPFQKVAFFLEGLDWGSLNPCGVLTLVAQEHRQRDLEQPSLHPFRLCLFS